MTQSIITFILNNIGNNKIRYIGLRKLTKVLPYTKWLTHLHIGIISLRYVVDDTIYEGWAKDIAGALCDNKSLRQLRIGTTNKFHA